MLLRILLAAVCFCLIGCESSEPENSRSSSIQHSTSSIEQAWLGTGEFRASAGTTTMKVQLEILSDGTYRILILEPRAMMLAGIEKGEWKETGTALDLAPYPQQKKSDGILAGAPRDFRPKTLSIEGQYEALLLEDAQMSLRFEPNPEVTEKLRESGELE